MEEERIKETAAPAEGEKEAPSAEAPAEAGAKTVFAMEKDAGEFLRTHSRVNLYEMEHDEAFLRFCGKRLYKEPLSELYDDYQAMVERIKKATASRRDDRKDRATGSGAGNPGSGLTADQQRDLDAWNRAFPQLRMTAKEFLTRE